MYKIYEIFLPKAISAKNSIHLLHFRVKTKSILLSLAFNLDVAGAITIEEKRLCDVHQHAGGTLLEAVKSGDKSPTEKHSYSAAINQTLPENSHQSGLPNLAFDQQTCIQLFTMPVRNCGRNRVAVS